MIKIKKQKLWRKEPYNVERLRKMLHTDKQAQELCKSQSAIYQTDQDYPSKKKKTTMYRLDFFSEEQRCLSSLQLTYKTWHAYRI